MYYNLYLVLRWCSKISPKGPIDVKSQYLVEITDATYIGKVGDHDKMCEPLSRHCHNDLPASYLPFVPNYPLQKVGR